MLPARHHYRSAERDRSALASSADIYAPGIKPIGRYGANAQHTLFFIVEAEDGTAIHKFFCPGFERCTATVTPVSEAPVPKD